MPSRHHLAGLEMAVAVTDEGAGNRLLADEDFLANGTGRITFRGHNSVVSVAAGCVTSGIDFTLGTGSSITVGADCVLGYLFIYLAEGASVTVGAGCGFNGLIRLMAHEPGRIEIGQGCLFAGGTDLSVSDMHSIVDTTTGRRINPAGDISLGDRVWIGVDALVLKGTRIGEGSVIGARSVVTRDIPANALAAGSPARVIKTNVSWQHDLI